MEQYSQQEELNILKQVNQLVMGIENVDHNISSQRIPEKVILLMGETKAGKTTLLYYLLKKKLILEKNRELGIVQMKAEAICFNARIGNNYQSTTVYPNIPTDIDEGTQECLIIDMPGFNDTRSRFRLLNIYIIHEVIKHIKTVHISVVLPFQSLQGESLVQALLNTCILLNADFFKAKHCLSFILTKVQNQQQDMQNFKQEMNNIADMYQEQPISLVVNKISERNIYMFCNKEPDIDAGGELKKRILHQNQFYCIDQNPSKLLSDDYANIIIGRGNIDQFNNYVVNIINELANQFGKLIRMFRYMIIYQHFSLVSPFYAKEMDLKSISEKIESLKDELNLGNISEDQPIYTQINFNDQKKNIISFVSKMKRLKGDNGLKIRGILSIVNEFVGFSDILAKQQSGIPKQIREIVHIYLKNGLILISTISELSHLKDVEKALKDIFESKQIEYACSVYFQMISNQELLKVMLDEAEQFNQSSSQFEQTLLFYHPNLVFNKDYEIKIVHQPAMNKIQRSQWQNEFAKTERAKRGGQQVIIQEQIESVMRFSVEDINENIEYLKKLDGNSLKFLFESVREMMKNKQIQYLSFKHQLWSKIIRILSQLHLFEQAIMFTLSIPDQIEAQYLIDLSVKFNQISVEFIESILVPYFSKVSINFYMIQKLYSFISLKATSFEKMIQVETTFISVLIKMRQALNAAKGESVYELKRFNQEFISFVSEGKVVDEILKIGKNRLVKLKSCSLVNKSINTQLQSLEHTC